jgi:hypothetical protein
MKNLNFLCEACTGGGPVAVMSLATARDWNGGWGDYFRVIGEHTGGPLQFFHVGERVSGFLFHQVDDGDFGVYHDKDNIVVLNEGYAPDPSSSIRLVLPDYEPYIVSADPVVLVPFDKHMAIFDSVYPGKLISLVETGFQRIGLSDEPESDVRLSRLPNAVVLEVNPGSWSAVSLHRQDERYSYDGVLFRRSG